MSIQKHFEENGIQLQPDNSLPLGQRSQKHFKRVIAAVRAAEADARDELDDANEKCRNAQEQVIALQAQIAVMRAELAKVKVKERLDMIDDAQLSRADKHDLLQIAAAS